jgi:hypothetical protein
MYLHIEDLEAIKEFMMKFKDVDTVELEADSSSGIGTTLTARLHNVEINGERVTVSKVISDVENW